MSSTPRTAPHPPTHTGTCRQLHTPGLQLGQSASSHGTEKTNFAGLSERTKWLECVGDSYKSLSLSSESPRASSPSPLCRNNPGFVNEKPPTNLTPTARSSHSPSALGAVERHLALVLGLPVRLEVVPSGEGRVAEVTEEALLVLLPAGREARPGGAAQPALTACTTETQIYAILCTNKNT